MSSTVTIETLTSADGTEIAYRRSGEGPPLVLVHGGISDSSYWHAVLPELDTHFTVYALERRGRGRSVDSTPYAPEREHEDIAALVDSIGEPVHLVGHSYGAFLSLEAALLTRGIRSLVLYEPPLQEEGFSFPPGFVDRLDDLIAAGDDDGVIRVMMADVVGLSPAELAELAETPHWPTLVATASSLPRELRSVETYRFDPERFRTLDVPTLLLEGDQSPDELRVGVRLLDAVLPDSRLVTMSGVGHEAVETGPDVFAAALLDGLAR